MPIFIYQHPETEEIREIIQSVHEKHEFIENNIKWQRIFTVPQASENTKLDAFDSKGFVAKTGNIKYGTMNDLYNRSKDLSEKRKDLAGGIDPIKTEFKKEYARKRRGTALPQRNGNQYYHDRD